MPGGAVWLHYIMRDSISTEVAEDFGLFAAKAALGYIRFKALPQRPWLFIAESQRGRRIRWNATCHLVIVGGLGGSTVG